VQRIARTGRWGAVLLVCMTFAAAATATAEQASEPTAAAAGQLDAGRLHTCALNAGVVRCWGAGNSGQLGTGSPATIGDDEPPGAAPAVDFGPGRFATAISAGDFHTCAVLDDGTVRCWGFGSDGRLGYGTTQTLGDNESLTDVPPVDIGSGRTAVAISAGGAHTCAVLDTGSVLCWGFGEDGRLGYGDPASIGDDETPGTLAPVQIGAGRTATAVSAGSQHTCALLDDKSVRCWGTNGTLFGGDGRLGYGDTSLITIGDNETPATVGPVVLGAGATAISAGEFHTCAVLEGGAVRCWGNGADGRLGYGDEQRIGDNETPGSVGPVEIGGPATAISVSNHTCARLTNGAVRCWGPGTLGRLGYANTSDIGDDEAPGAAGPVALGGATVAISAGGTHTCVRLGDGNVRCWGEGTFGRLGHGSESNVGDDETPLAIGPVDLTARAAPPGNPPAGGGVTPGSPAAPGGPAAPGPATPDAVAVAVAVADPLDEALRLQARRAADLRGCRASATSKRRSARTRARQRYRQPRVLARVLRGIDRTAAQRRTRCVRRFGRMPGRVKSLVARRASHSRVVLAFDAVGSDGSKAPAARRYVVKQSLRPIRTTRQFDRAASLCGGTCRFDVARPGDDITVNVDRLRRRTTYYYAVAARDNVSARRGPRSRTVSIRTG